MIQINLLPIAAGKRRQDDKQFLLAYAACVFLTLAVIGYMWISQASQLNTANRQVGELDGQMWHYAKYGPMLKDLKGDLALIKRKITVIKGLEKGRDTTVRALAVLSAEIPVDEMWLENLKQDADTISLSGVALNNETIAKFMRNLDSSPYVEKGSVNLERSSQILMNNKKLRKFQLSYRFHALSAPADAHASATRQQHG